MWTILLLLALNLAVSWISCGALGRIYNDAKVLKGWLRVLAWCGALLAALGFSSVIGFFVGAALVGIGWLPLVLVSQVHAHWTWLLLVPALAGACIVLAELWLASWRDHRIAWMSAAAFTSFVLAHNAAASSDGIGRVLQSVDDLFTGDDGEGGSVLRVAVGIVMVALGSGALVTAILIRHYADTAEFPAQMAA